MNLARLPPALALPSKGGKRVGEGALGSQFLKALHPGAESCGSCKVRGSRPAPPCQAQGEVLETSIRASPWLLAAGHPVLLHSSRFGEHTSHKPSPVVRSSGSESWARGCTSSPHGWNGPAPTCWPHLTLRAGQQAGPGNGPCYHRLGSLLPKLQGKALDTETGVAKDKTSISTVMSGALHSLASPSPQQQAGVALVLPDR